MNKIKFLLVFIVLFSVGYLFAQNVLVGFGDITNALTKAALDIEAVPLLGAPYTNAFPVSANRWRFQWYTDGGDGIISPLDAAGNPTGDDFITVGNVSPGNTTGTVALGPTQLWAPSAAAINPPGGIGNTFVGDRVYLRIFNANTIAAATKSMAFHTLYTILSSSPQSIKPYIPAYAWGPWTPINPVYYVHITSNPSLQPIWVNGAYSGHNTPWDFELAEVVGLPIAINNPMFNWNPLQFIPVAQAADQSQLFEGTPVPQYPLPAINPVPPNGAQIQAPDSFFDVFLNWDWDPAGLQPHGYKLYLNGAIEPIIIMGAANSEYLWMGFNNLVGAVYTWQVVPFIEDLKGKTRELKPMTKGDAFDCPVWSFEVLPYEEPPTTYTVFVTSDPMGAQIFVDGSPYLVGGNPVFTGMNPVLVILEAGPHILSLIDPTGEYTFEPVPVNEQTPPAIFFQGEGGQVPVELSSFTAVFAAGFYVELAWVVQSETNHLGYNVLRGDSNVLADAATLNVTPISSGSVTGTQISYNFRDEQIESNHTYYYWLESVDLNGMTYFFGPISVIVTSDVPEDPTPVIPTVTALLDAYPNPFNASNATTIRYNLKNSGSVKIEITNLKGQTIWSTVRSYDKAGAYQVSWNGKDMNGKSVATGIYYYRMTSGKYTAGKKIVLVK